MSEHRKGKYPAGGAGAPAKPRAPAKPAVRPGGPETAAPAARDAIGRRTGTDSPDLSHLLLRDALLDLKLMAGRGKAARLRRIRATMAALAGIAPRDPIEGMLAAQMVAVHEVAMDSLRQAVHPKQTEYGCEMSISQAVRLMALYGRQMESLARHRGRVAQTVSVGHVQIEPGAQAVVGNVTQTRGDGEGRE